MAKRFDPYATIPSADVLQEKIDELREQLRRLRKLLKLAKEIERETQPRDSRKK